MDVRSDLDVPPVFSPRGGPTELDARLPVSVRALGPDGPQAEPVELDAFRDGLVAQGVLLDGLVVRGAPRALFGVVPQAGLAGPAWLLEQDEPADRAGCDFQELAGLVQAARRVAFRDEQSAHSVGPASPLPVDSRWLRGDCLVVLPDCLVLHCLVQAAHCLVQAGLRVDLLLAPADASPEPV